MAPHHLREGDSEDTSVDSEKAAIKMILIYSHKVIRLIYD
jgi:hypothetical protein